VETWPSSRSYAPGQIQPGGKGLTQPTGEAPSGRWPPNVLLSPEAADEMDRQGGNAGGGIVKPYKRASHDYYSGAWPDAHGGGYDDSGGASRFFPCFRYEAKPSRAERNAGLEGMEKRTPRDLGTGDNSVGEGRGSLSLPRENHHPTVKPIALMAWLCRLVTPKGGLVLDPFLGSGTTGIAALREGFRFLGIEREADYMEIAQRRIREDAPMFNTVEVVAT